MSKHFATIIIDFDSTIVQVESLEDLACIALQGRADCQERVQAITELTNQAMAGQLTFDVALARRIPLLSARREHLAALAETLRGKITPSLIQQQEYIRASAEKFYVVSGGFKEFIVPVVEMLGFRAENVFANEFVFDEEGNIVGANTENFLAQEDGKTKLLQHLRLPRPRLIIGDGFSDFQLKASGEADAFYVLTENISRPSVIACADRILPDFTTLHAL